MDTLKKYLLSSLVLAATLTCLVTTLVLVFMGGANPIYLACVGVVGAILGYRVVKNDVPAVWRPLLASWLD